MAAEAGGRRLEQELGYRTARALCGLDPRRSRPRAVSQSASRLKKHFQEVPFLRSGTIKRESHHHLAAFVDVLASTWAFVWQSSS